MGNDSELILSREYLYSLVANSIDQLDPYIRLKNSREFIRDVFRDSAKFVSYFEKDINNKQDYSFDEFDRLIKQAMNEIENDSFKEVLDSRILKESYKRFEDRKKNYSYKAIIVSVFKDIAAYHNILIEKSFVNPFFKESDKEKIGNRPQTFLSYAYYDKGLSLGLFLYFQRMGGFLYVNWMWNGTNDDSSITKIELDKELYKSSQFLLLRTLNSEFDYYAKKQIRQWCSWEIGNYYNKNPDEKYYVSFYDGDSASNDLLMTFKVFGRVYNGTIIEKR